MLNASEIKKDFPIFKRTVGDKPLVYLDNAATSHKPQVVIDSVSDFYSNHNANVHRGIHMLSEEASELYEKARQQVADFIDAVRPKEIVFTSGTTDSLNLVAESWGMNNLKKGDEVLISNSEHHSNLVPWQIVSQKTGAKLKFVDYTSGSQEDYLSSLKGELNERVKLVVASHASNVTGAITPIKELSKLAHEVGALVVVDGAQAIPHLKVSMKSLDCDFYAFSGHKMLGPTGIGVLWVREELLQEMVPYKTGGGMISTVNEQDSTWAGLPDKFEAGTPNIAGAVGLGEAIEYLGTVGMENIRNHEIELNEYALQKISEIDGVYFLGSEDAETRTGLVSFHVEGLHAHDISAILNTEGVAVRSGHHCAMPLHTKLSVSASTRASYYLYNTKKDIDVLISAIEKALKILK